MSMPVAVRSKRRGSAAVRLPGLWVRNPPLALMCVSCASCVLQVEASATVRSLVERRPTEFVSMSVLGCNNNPIDLQYVVRRGLKRKSAA